MILLSEKLYTLYLDSGMRTCLNSLPAKYRGTHAGQLNEIYRSIAPRQDSYLLDNHFHKLWLNILVYSLHGAVLKSPFLRPTKGSGM